MCRLKITSPLLISITALSGAAGLGYEIVWTRMLALGLGNESASVLAVLAAFFGGSALGAIILDNKISRSVHPVRWYILLELVTGIWALVLGLTLPQFSRVVALSINATWGPVAQWGLSFLLPFTALFPATCAMGGTLIAMERILSRFSGTSEVGLTYAVNTLGAVLGVSLVYFHILPAAGFVKSLYLLGAASLLCALAALLIKLPCSREDSTATKENRTPFYLALLLCGLLGIGYEIVMIRALAQIVENTVYSFAATLSVYLFGSFLGATLYNLFRKKLTCRAVIILLLLATTAGTLLLRVTPDIFKFTTNIARGSIPLMLAAEYCTALLVLIIPTVAMGYSFSLFSSQVRDARDGFGRAIAINTAGAMVAPVIFGVILLPLLGLQGVLICSVAGYGILAFIPGLISDKKNTIPVLLTALLCLGTTLKLVPTSAFFTHLKPGEQIVERIDGVLATCTVTGDNRGARHLIFNSRFQEGGTESPETDCREAAIPLLLHPAPKRALFLGIGAGVTFATAGWFSDIRADGVELIPEMRSLLHHFIGNALPDNCSLITADARRYTTVCKEKYDVIIADLYHPARDGAGFLYTHEHFLSIKRLLLPNGIFCQWLPLYQMDQSTLRTILHTFLSVYPHTSLWLVNNSVEMPVVGLMGTSEPLTVDPRRIETLSVDSILKHRLEAIKLYSTLSLTGGYLGADSLAERYAGNVPRNSDDLPHVMFKAPSFVYGSSSQTSGDKIKTLLSYFSTSKAPLVIRSADDSLRNLYTDTFYRYRNARDRFIDMGISITSSQVHVSQDALTDSLLKFISMSPEFESGYNPLVGIALEHLRRNPQKSLNLLRTLDTICPQRSDARYYIDHIENTYLSNTHVHGNTLQ